MALYRVTVMPEPVTYTVEAPTEKHARLLALEWFDERSHDVEVSEPLCPCQCDVECDGTFTDCGACFRYHVKGEGE